MVNFSTMKLTIGIRRSYDDLGFGFRIMLKLPEWFSAPLHPAGKLI